MRSSIVAALVLVLGVFGTEVGWTRQMRMGDLPHLRIVSPVDGATVSNPVSIVFDTPADLSKMTMGRGVPKTTPHLHISLDQRVFMPAMKHLIKLRTGRYVFLLGKVAPGRHTILLYWAELDTHTPIEPVERIRIIVR